MRRDSKAVMQRPAKPFRPVRLRLAPPVVDVKKSPDLSGLFFFGHHFDYWTSLLFIDPLTVLLLLVVPRVGLILCVAVIVTDVAHNSWFALHYPVQMDLYLSQIAFLLFVVCTVRTAWRGTAVRRTVSRAIN